MTASLQPAVVSFVAAKAVHHGLEPAAGPDIALLFQVIHRSVCLAWLVVSLLSGQPGSSLLSSSLRLDVYSCKRVLVCISGLLGGG